ncbi:hypothetical protein ACHAXM_003765 [Skeletonema potamos]|jgi:hypothetical protein
MNSIVEVRSDDPPDLEMVISSTSNKISSPPRDTATPSYRPAASPVPSSSIHSTNAIVNSNNNDKTNKNVDDKHARRPRNVALTQQRMKSWQPILDSRYVIGAYLTIGIIFLIVGFIIRNESNAIIELVRVYESYTTDMNGLTINDGTNNMEKLDPTSNVESVIGCEIGNNPNSMYLSNTTCQIKLKVPDDGRDMQPPVLVHYQVNNFYQNYRTYQVSYDMAQLLGSLRQDMVSAELCAPLNTVKDKEGVDIKINPCGLIANTLFNDVFTLESVVGPDNVTIEGAVMNETGIAWKSDLKWKYRQPEGFNYEACPSFDECSCDGSEWSCIEPYQSPNGTYYRYFYPEDNTTQYLYETYPMVVSPIEGVLNEHFVVWMRTAALPNFRKLYGYIDVVIPAGSVLTFNVQANWAVQQSQSAKALVVSDNYMFGGKNHWLGTMFIAVGGIAAVLGLFFLVIQLFFPRKLGDRTYLKYKEE